MPPGSHPDDKSLFWWLHLHDVETAHDMAKELSRSGDAFHQKRMTMAQDRYLAALRILAQVRRFGVPVGQVNIAEQQVNLVQKGGS